MMMIMWTIMKMTMIVKIISMKAMIITISIATILADTF